MTVPSSRRSDTPVSQRRTGVLVIGDVMLDVWTHARFRKRSPEAPIDVVNASDTVRELGGAANAFLCTEDFAPGRNHLIGAIGADPSGAIVSEMLLSFSDRAWLLSRPEVPTTTKNRIFVDGDPILRLDREDPTPLADREEQELLEHVEETLTDVGCVLFSDYAKGALSPRAISAIVALAQREGIPTLADPALGRLQNYAGVQVVKPNALEWSTYVADFTSEEEALEALWDSGTEHVLITMGSDGMRLVSASQVVSATDARATAVDVTGAGDVVAAASASLLARGAPLEQNLDSLVGMGSLAVSFVGTRPTQNVFTPLSGA